MADSDSQLLATLLASSRRPRRPCHAPSALARAQAWNVHRRRTNSSVACMERGRSHWEGGSIGGRASHPEQGGIAGVIDCYWERTGTQNVVS